jgi:hypothetical protein
MTTPPDSGHQLAGKQAVADNCCCGARLLLHRTDVPLKETVRGPLLLQSCKAFCSMYNEFTAQILQRTRSPARSAMRSVTCSVARNFNFKKMRQCLATWAHAPQVQVRATACSTCQIGIWGGLEALG